MLPYILAIVACLIIGLVVVVWLQPGEFRVERSALIAAPPPAVFEQVNDLRRWEAWSPWHKRDPNMKLTYAGPAAGEGARYAWLGNREVGEGRLTIVESRPPERIGILLEFMKPFKATNDTLFTFRTEGEGTRVTWAMSGKNNFVGKAIGLVMNMDKMIGGDFEAGLGAMALEAERAAGREAVALPAPSGTPSEPKGE